MSAPQPTVSKTFHLETQKNWDNDDDDDDNNNKNNNSSLAKLDSFLLYVLFILKLNSAKHYSLFTV